MNAVEIAAREFALRGWNVTGDTAWCIASKSSFERGGIVSGKGYRSARVEIRDDGRGSAVIRLANWITAPSELRIQFKWARRQAHKSIRKASKQPGLSQSHPTALGRWWNAIEG